MLHEAAAERFVAADATRVWAALTEPAELGRWFWPWSPAVDFSAEPGAPYAITASHPVAGRIAVDGRVMAASPPERLALTWRWTDEPGPVTEVEFRLAAVEAGTRVAVRHRRIADATTAVDYAQAWNDLLDRLVAFLQAP